MRRFSTGEPESGSSTSHEFGSLRNDRVTDCRISLRGREDAGLRAGYNTVGEAGACQRSSRPAYPFDKERELIGMVRLGDRNRAREMLNDILGTILYCNEDYCSARDFEVMKVRIMELVVILSRSAVEGGANIDSLLGLNCVYLQELTGLERMEELWIWLVKVLDRFMDIVYESRNPHNFRVIGRAVDYIREHYMDCDLSLNRVAKAIYVSPYYLSHLFSDELGVTFTGYVTGLRIERAKELLRTTDKGIAEIADLVGYSDSSYFSKVFKKQEKVTPQDFRRGFFGSEEGRSG